MRARTASVLAWSALVLVGLLMVAGGWLAAVNVGTPIPDELGDVAPGSFAVFFPTGLAFLVIGSLIVARRRTGCNPSRCSNVVGPTTRS